MRCAAAVSLAARNTHYPATWRWLPDLPDQIAVARSASPEALA